MCQTIFINRGEIEIGTPQEFKNHFGFLPENEEHWNKIDMDMCLCQYDLEETFKKHNIEFKTDCGDFFVGKLDLVKGDNE